MKKLQIWIEKKKKGEKITVLTAYDFAMAKLLEETGVDIILIGDSLGMVFQGGDSTRYVSMHHMEYHTSAVAKGAPNTFKVADLPIGSYNDVAAAVLNSHKLIKAGAQAVKLEGNPPKVIKAIVDAGIPVMGHLGLLPQTAESYKVRGKEQKEAEQIKADAHALVAAGVFSMVLECVPMQLATQITQEISVPTIGIGAGRHTDGQVLVINDLLGITSGYVPKFVEKYADLTKIITDSVSRYISDVKEEKFPDDKHSYH